MGWDPLIGDRTVDERTGDIAGPLREGTAMLIAVAVAVFGLVALGAWLLTAKHSSRDHTFRVGRRAERLRVDRDSLAASLERRLDALDRRVDATVTVDRRGRVDLRLVTPDTSPTGTVAEHSAALQTLLDERGLPCRLGSVDVIDVRRIKSRHRVR